jgi:hypothetical protein
VAIVSLDSERLKREVPARYRFEGRLVFDRLVSGAAFPPSVAGPHVPSWPY